jgi:hypothetical protein
MSNAYLVMSPRWGSTPRQTGRLTVGRNLTLTLYFELGGLLRVPPKQYIKIIRGLNLEMVKFTTVQATRLPLQQ